MQRLYGDASAWLRASAPTDEEDLGFKPGHPAQLKPTTASSKDGQVYEIPLTGTATTTSTKAGLGLKPTSPPISPPLEPWQERDAMIAAAVTTSKAAGAVHLDTMPLGVEALRGRRFRSLRDGQEWVVTTVDNRGTVYFVGADGVGKEEISGRELAEFVRQPPRLADLKLAIKSNTGKNPSPKRLAASAAQYGFAEEPPARKIEVPDGQTAPPAPGPVPGRGREERPAPPGERPQSPRVRQARRRAAAAQARAARVAAILDDLVAQATRGGYTGETTVLKAELEDRLQLIRELDAEFSDSGRNPEALLRAIAGYGGLSIKAETGQKGEIAWLKELRDLQPSRSRKNLLAPPVAGDSVRGIRGVFRNDGLSLDGMLEALRQEERFTHIETLSDLFAEIRTAATADPDQDAADRLVEGLGGGLWWAAIGRATPSADDADISFDPEVLEAQPPTVDTLDTGEDQPRLPEAGPVRDTDVKTPELDAPFSLSGGADTTVREVEQDLFGRDLDDLRGDDPTKPQFSRPFRGAWDKLPPVPGERTPTTKREAAPEREQNLFEQDTRSGEARDDDPKTPQFSRASGQTIWQRIRAFLKREIERATPREFTPRHLTTEQMDADRKQFEDLIQSAQTDIAAAFDDLTVQGSCRRLNTRRTRKIDNTRARCASRGPNCLQATSRSSHARRARSTTTPATSPASRACPRTSPPRNGPRCAATTRAAWPSRSSGHCPLTPTTWTSPKRRRRRGPGSKRTAPARSGSCLARSMPRALPP